LKREKRSVTGILLLNKPLGISSNAALTRTKILFNADKAGHTGTLDPFASGLLPVCFGEATKFAGFMLDADKTYEAVIHLGQTSSTGDREGTICTELPVRVTIGDVAEVLNRFTGRITQIPPMHSAIKHQGQRLYQLARQGINVARETRVVTIHQLELMLFEPPLLTVRVVCSKGTYIRVLAEDIGHSLGCGGMLDALCRIGTGGFTLKQASTLDHLSELPLDARDQCLMAPDELVAHFSKIELDDREGKSLLEGRTLLTEMEMEMESGTYRAYGRAGEFFGLVDLSDGVIKARRMMSNPFLSPDFSAC